MKLLVWLVSWDALPLLAGMLRSDDEFRWKDLTTVTFGLADLPLVALGFGGYWGESRSGRVSKGHFSPMSLRFVTWPISEIVKSVNLRIGPL
jgi:hypothetical protein